MRHYLLALLAIASLNAQLLVDTYAGGAIPSGVPANNVALGNITGIAWDPSGNIVIADGQYNVIRRIAPNGIITTIVGTGETGFAGDGGPATSALINISNPAACQYDAQGNLYFFDSLNYRIRRVDTKGIITTIAGDGQSPVGGPESDGPALARPIAPPFFAVDPNGIVYLSDNGGNLLRVTIAGKLEFFVQIPFIVPGGLVTDALGNVYFLNQYGDYYEPQTLYRVTPSGVISTFATFNVNSSQPPPGNGNLTSDFAGNIYTYVNGQLLRYAPDGTSTPVAGPFGAINNQGDRIFVSTIFPNPANHEGLNVIQKFTAQSGLTTVAGANAQPSPDGTPLKDAWFLGNIAFAFSRSGDLYIADFGACVIRKISAGVLSTFAGSGTCGSSPPSGNAKTANLGNPVNIAIDSQNNVWVAEYRSLSLYAIAQDGTISRTMTSPAAGGFIEQLAIDGKDRVYSMNNFSLIRYSADGSSQTRIGPAPPPAVLMPIDGIPVRLGALLADAAGNVYLNGGPANLFIIHDDGTLALSLPSLPDAASLAFDPSGNLWGSSTTLATANPSGIAKVGYSQFGFSGDGGPAQSARMNADGSIAFGPDGNLYFADNAIRIRRVTGSGPSAAPVISQGGIVNAVTYSGASIAPGEFISIFGANFGAASLEVNPAVNNAIPFTIGRTKVLFNGQPGAITAITPTQINVFVPYGVTTPVPVQVQVDNILSAAVSIPLVPTAPGLSLSILNQDGTVNTAGNPAPRGSIVSFFGTGLGQMTPQLNDGNLAISTPYSTAVNTPTLSIGGQPATILYAGDAPTFPTGVSQINAMIPAAINPGPALVTIAGASTQITVAVK